MGRYPRLCRGYQVSNCGRIKSLDRITNNGHKRKGIMIETNINSKGYLLVNLHKNGIMKTRSVHQLVAESFMGHIPNGHMLVINHIDFDKLNNNLTNLEITTQRANTDKKHLPSTSKYVGVYWDSQNKKWRAQIRINGKKKYLGYFNDEYEAHLAYQNKLNTIKNERNR